MVESRHFMSCYRCFKVCRFFST